MDYLKFCVALSVIGPLTPCFGQAGSSAIHLPTVYCTAHPADKCCDNDALKQSACLYARDETSGPIGSEYVALTSATVTINATQMEPAKPPQPKPLSPDIAASQAKASTP
jgi:hypothetical protein